MLQHVTYSHIGSVFFFLLFFLNTWPFYEKEQKKHLIQEIPLKRLKQKLMY